MNNTSNYRRTSIDKSSNYQRQHSEPNSVAAAPSKQQKRGRSDSLTTDKSGRLFPHAVLRNGDKSETKNSKHSEKKKYKILNDLERRGLAQKRRELEIEIARKPTDANRLALEKAKLQELESCYQFTKNAFAKSKEELEKLQEAQTGMKEETRLKDFLFEQVKKARDDALKGKRLAVDDLEWYERHYHEKKSKLEKAESKLATVEEQHSNHLKQTIQEWEKRNETLHNLLKQETESHAETLEKYQKTQAECVLLKNRLDELERADQSMKESNVTLMRNYNAELKRNEESQQQIQEAKETLFTLQTGNTELQATIQEQETCIHGIEKLLQKYRATTLAELF